MSKQRKNKFTKMSARALADLPVHPLADRFPMMSGQELQNLRSSIMENGQQHPVVICDGMLVDGRNRVAACKAHDLELDVVDKTGAGDDQLHETIKALNVDRRNLKPSTTALCVRPFA